MSARAAILSALGAALLFGASTPFARALVGDVPPILLAGLLYLGSGIGLWVLRLVRDRRFAPADLSRAEWGWLSGAIAAGGALGPALLMFGLTKVTAAHASLLLNLEGVLTALLAWVVFRENVDRRIALGMALIIAGGALLAWPSGAGAGTSLWGALAVAGACLCWAIDNNLTRKLSANDPIFIAGTKGLAAGVVNVGLALAFGARPPSAPLIAGAVSVGFLGYGVSLVLFVVALRGLGAARTSAYFSLAPFAGAAIAIALFHEPTSAGFWAAAMLMATGIWLHLSERHEHQHSHGLLIHTHSHQHDSHHQHAHAFTWDGREPHVHEHRHEPLTHSHPHYPDIHHRHGH
ncbi:MAG: DMT family transporter [Gammaproteobacteria bacterium]|nr:DMT family transporter [Gammaproteobacteria bacterium]